MQILSEIIRQAVELGASDLHLKTGAAPSVRIQGQLQRLDHPALDREMMERILDAVLASEARERFTREHEADVAFVAAGMGRFRANAFQERGQPCLALRRVEDRVPDFKQLNLPFEWMARLAAGSAGMVLIAGATGAGKSTTLAAMVAEINRTSSRHVISIEDPIEFLHEDDLGLIEQREIGIDTRDFPTALRHIIRQDPDVIVIGEMRDAESFRAGLAAAHTGHLVLTTLHADNVRQSVDRLLAFFDSSERDQMRRLMGAAVRAIICQRLVPAVAGGSVPALEVLRSTESTRKLFEKDRLDQLDQAMSVGEADGMMTFDQSLFALATAGRISEQEALASASNPEQLAMNFKGIFATSSRLIS